MRGVLLLVTACAMFAVLPYTARGDVVSGTLLPVVLAIALAIAVAGRVSGASVMAGAVAALTGSLAWGLVPCFGGALVLTLAYLERTLRVRSLPARAVHVALATAGGGSAGMLSASYAHASPVLFGVALALCGVLCAAPLLVAADERRVVILEAAARRLGPPLALALREAADLLRSWDALVVDAETAAQMATSWRSLERVIEGRLRLVGSPRTESGALVTGMLDRQIAEHIASLLRAVAASTMVGAAEAGLDDRAMRDVHARGEVLEEQSRAMVEVRGR